MGAVATENGARPGLSVPKEFSLVCFNNEPVIRLSIPSLTAVDVPSAAMGEAAAQILLHEMGGEGTNGDGTTKPVCRKLEERLIVRESTTTPKRTS